MCKCLDKLDSAKGYTGISQVGIDDILLHKLALGDNLTIYFPGDYSSTCMGKGY